MTAHTAAAALGEGVMWPELFAAGHARGLKDCEATHGAIYHEGYTRAMQEWADVGDEHGSRRGEARGRLQGALIVAVLVGLAMTLARRWGR